MQPWGASFKKKFNKSYRPQMLNGSAGMQTGSYRVASVGLEC